MCSTSQSEAIYEDRKSTFLTLIVTVHIYRFIYSLNVFVSVCVCVCVCVFCSTPEL
jgi:hypothetical protein